LISLKDDKFIHRYIPATSAKDGAERRTLLLLHGTGGDENDLIPLGQMLIERAGAEMNILSPRGRVTENGMPRFFRRFAEGVFDEEDLKFRAGELADFIEAAAEEYEFDATKIIAVGYSNGANIAAAMLLLRPRTLTAAALLHPMMPFTPSEIPDLSHVSALVSAGRLDPIARAEEAEKLVAVLKQSKAEVTLNWQNGGHNLTGIEVEETGRWLAALASKI
jgi:predicted esterase